MIQLDGNEEVFQLFDSRTIQESSEVGAATRGALEAVLKATGASHGSIVMLGEAEPKVLSEEVAVTLQSGALRGRPTGEVIAEVEREGHAVYFESPAATDEPAESQCAVAIPITAGAKVTGVLTLSDRLEGRLFSDECVTLLTGLGTILGSAVENARLVHRLRWHASIKDRLIAVGQTLATQSEESKVIETSLAGLKSVFGSTYSVLRLLDHETGELVLRASDGMSVELQERARRVRPEGTLLGAALTTGEPMAIDDTIAPNVEFSLPYYASEMRSLAVAPVMLQNKRLGTLKAYCPVPRRWTRSDLEYMHTLASQLGLALENARLQQSMRARYWSTLKCLAAALEARDPYTDGHSSRVSRLAMLCAIALRLTHEQREHLRLAALLHDIGKIGVPDSALMKRTYLGPAEWDLIKRHPVVGAKMLALAEFPSDVVVAVRHHHERWSGGGYPDRLAGQDIPLLAQIISVADSYDAITSDRPYRRKLASREAAAELRRAAGGQLSPSVVDALLGIHARELEDILLDRFR